MRTLLVLGLISTLGACADDGGDDTSYNCEKETDVDEFVVGLSKMGTMGKLEFKLMSGDPAPPSRGDNSWVLQLNTMAAPVAPVTGATITVSPFMPAHKHPAGKTATTTPLTDAGQYRLEPLDLWMPGVWETTIDVESTSGDKDKVVFRFCLPS